MLLSSTHGFCCGVIEIHGIDEIEDTNAVIRQFCEAHSEPDCGACLFTSVVRGKYTEGDKLKAFIRKNKLGKVIGMCVRNPNTDNNVKMYLWQVNWDRLYALVDKQEESTNE